MEEKVLTPNQINSLSQLFEVFGFGRFGLLLMSTISFNWFVDGMELTLSSIVSPIIKQQWKLTPFQEAFISSGVYFGAGVGSLTFGFLADKHGRKLILLLGNSIAMYFAFLGVASDNFVSFFLIRFFVGLGIGTISISTPYVTEFLAIKYRAKCIISLALVFATGNTFASIMAYFLVNKYGWRIYLTSLAIPIPILIILMFFMPESLSYLQNKGDVNAMTEVISYIAKLNKVYKLPRVKLHLKTNDETDFISQIRKKYWKRLALCIILIIIGGILYYGCVFYGTQIYALNLKSTNENFNIKDNQYLHNALTTLGDYFGIIVYLFLVPMMNKKKLMIISFLSTTLFFIVINMSLSETINTILLFIFRGVATSNFQLVWYITAESFPTSIRGTSVGLCISLHKFSLIFVPFLVQWLTTLSKFLSPAIFVLLALVGSICSYRFPAEVVDTYIDEEEEQ